MTERRDIKGFAKALFKGCHKGPVFRSRSLETDMLTNVRLTGHLLKVIFSYRMNHSGKYLLNAVSLAKELVDITLHKNGTAIAGQWCRSPYGHTLIILQFNTQPASQFFNKTTGTGCTDRIHMRESYHPVLHLGKLGILSANFNDRIGLRIEFKSSPGMSGYLIHILVGSYNAANEFTSRPGRSTGQKFRLNVMFIHQDVTGLEKSLNSPERLSQGIGIESGNRPAICINQYRLCTGGPHINTKVVAPISFRQIPVDIHLDLPFMTGYYRHIIPPCS